jgi:glucose dehydrogenase
MRRSALACGLLATAALSSPVLANEDTKKAVADPNNWALQQGDYAGWRYSRLDQINTDNVKDIKVAWQFSTGVLRGHEGSPVVVGNRMYVHSAFPNNVFALNLDDENKILWKYSPKQDPSVIPVMLRHGQPWRAGCW